MRSARIYDYQLPLEAGVVLRERRLKTRDGLLVHLQDGHREGWGEIAPLPGFSDETLTEAQHEARAWLSCWCAGEEPPESQLPSVAFGLSCALAEYAGTLPLEGTFSTALLCSGNPDDLLQRLRHPSRPLAKMKVGLYEAVRDGMQVNLLLEALPELTLRLDANRAWSLEKALSFARYISPELRARIAFIEEPCRDRSQSLAFAAQTGIHIAWDESQREAATPLAAHAGLAALVIKPTLTGSIDRVRQQAEEAQALGLHVVISSALESSMGLTQLARLAHWLTPGVMPGLDTLPLMQSQLVRRWPGCELALQDKESLRCLWQR